jgi:hypothetical protein
VDLKIGRTEIIADAIKDPKCSDIEKRLRNRIRAHSRSIKRRRARQAVVAYGRSGDHSVDRRGGDSAKMRSALQRPEEIAVAPTPQPWQLIETFDRAWVEDKLRLRGITERFKDKYRRRLLRECKRQQDYVDLAPLQVPGWRPEREAEWEKTWEKSSNRARSVVPSNTRAA